MNPTTLDLMGSEANYSKFKISEVACDLQKLEGTLIQSSNISYKKEEEEKKP